MMQRKPIFVTTQEERMMIRGVIDEAESILEGSNKGSPTGDWKLGRRTLVVALVVAVLFLMVATLGLSVKSDSETATMPEEGADTAMSVSQEESALDIVPPTTTPRVQTETLKVPIVVRGAGAVESEPEPITVEDNPEAAEVVIVAPELVDQTRVEMRAVEVPEGVTENQFEGMEQTAPQPQTARTAPSAPGEGAVVVPAPTPSSNSSSVLPAPAPSFGGDVGIYLPIQTSVPKPLPWWKLVLEGTTYATRDSTVANGEARYFVKIDGTSIHGETINLALIVPRVDGVRDVRTDEKTELSDEQVRDKLIKDACLDVENLRTVMNQAKTDLAAKADSYELVLSWYTHRGERVAQDISDAELIGYCQLN